MVPPQLNSHGPTSPTASQPQSPAPSRNARTSIRKLWRKLPNIRPSSGNRLLAAALVPHRIFTQGCKIFTEERGKWTVLLSLVERLPKVLSALRAGAVEVH